MKKAPILIIILLLAGTSTLMFMKLSSIDKKHQVLIDELNKPVEESTDDFELADVMMKLQWHTNKLWFAGKAENWELSQFYLHEIEENFEELEESDVIEDNINFSSLASTIIDVPFEKLEESVKEKDAQSFEVNYVNLVNSCNNCHKAAKHPFIQISIPTTPAISNQVFTVDSITIDQ